MLAEIKKASEPSGWDITQAIRQALQSWLKRREAARFEEEWIAAFKKNPDDTSRAEDWLEAQAWTEQ
jgi:hypothetical protein